MTKALSNLNHQPRLHIKGGEVFCSTHDLATFVEKPHDYVCRAVKSAIREQEAAFAYAKETGKTVPEGGVFRFEETPYQHPQNDQFYEAFDLDRNATIGLVVGFRGPKATLWKMHYIAAFNEMERELADIKSGALVPVSAPASTAIDMRNPAHLAIAFAQVMEMAREAEARATDEAAQKALAIEAIDEMAPKAAFAEEVEASPELSTLKDAARACGVGQKEFFDYIKAKKYVFYEDEKLVPYAHHLQNGLFRVKYPTGNGKVRPQTFVTGKGISVLKSALMAKRNDLLSRLRVDRVPPGVTRPVRPMLTKTIN